MYILNKKTGVIQECANKDMIKTCKKYPKEYTLAEQKEDLVAGEAEKEEQKKNGMDLSKLKVEDLKTIAKENGIEGYESLNKAELQAVLKDVV